MKKQVLLIAFTFFILVFTNAQTSEKLEIDISKSELKWFGEHTFYFGGHQGIISFKEGYFIITETVITGGEFIIDMNSIIGTDNGKIDRDSGLVKHLKDPDFFDVSRFPISKLTITNVFYENNTRLKIKANLTIKGITLPINFKAEINHEKQQMITKFKIDRTRWGINYNSKLKDGAISDAIGFEVKLSL